MLLAGLTVPVARVDLGLNHPPTQRFRADAFLACDGRDRLRGRGVLGPMLEHEPDSSLPKCGINLLWHDAILSTRKDAASNLGRFSIAIQLAKHLGAFVATTTSGKNVDFVRSLGADLVIDYQTQNFGDELTGYDFVLDSLGGENLATSLRVLRPGGKAIGIAGPPTPEFAREIGMNPLLRLGVGAISRSIRAQAKKLEVSYEFLFMRANGAQLRQIADLVDAGTIRPIVGATYSFDHTPEALAALHVGGIRGKSVVIGAEATDS